MAFNAWPEKEKSRPAAHTEGLPVPAIVQSFIAASEQLQNREVQFVGDSSQDPGNATVESEVADKGDSFQNPGTAFALLSSGTEQQAQCKCQGQSVCPICMPTLFRSCEASGEGGAQQGASILAAMSAARAKEDAERASLSRKAKVPTQAPQAAVTLVPSCACQTGEACAICRPDIFQCPDNAGEIFPDSSSRSSGGQGCESSSAGAPTRGSTGMEASACVTGASCARGEPSSADGGSLAGHPSRSGDLSAMRVGSDAKPHPQADTHGVSPGAAPASATAVVPSDALLPPTAEQSANRAKSSARPSAAPTFYSMRQGSDRSLDSLDSLPEIDELSNQGQERDFEENVRVIEQACSQKSASEEVEKKDPLVAAAGCQSDQLAQVDPWAEALKKGGRLLPWSQESSNSHSGGIGLYIHKASGDFQGGAI